MRSAHQNGFEKKKNSKRRCHPLTSLAPRSLISRVHCQSWDRSLACLAALPLRRVVRCKGRKRGALYCMPPADDARAILPVPELSSAGRLALCLAPHCALANVREMRERKKRGKSLTDHRMKRALRCVVSHTWSLVAGLLREETAGCFNSLVSDFVPEQCSLLVTYVDLG